MSSDVVFIDLFSGIGGFHSGLEKVGMKCVGWCEKDKFAQKSYRALYDVEGVWFSDDIRKCRGWELPNANIWTFGFPCQDISVAGKQKGIKQGTRSGLFFEVMRLLDEKEESQPEWIIIENVKNLLSIDDGWGFFTILSEMAKRGYNVQWQVYNSKNYGVPQNRERVYVVGYYGKRRIRELLPIPRKNETTLNQIVPGHQGDRVYEPTLACTLAANGGGLGAKTGLYGVVNIRNGTNKGTAPATVGDGIDLSYIYSEARRGRVQKQAAQTVTTKGQVGILLNADPVLIRRLTPRECWRLQGFTDEQFNKVQHLISDTQLYKQAGNAVTVNVVEEIGRHIMKIIKNEVNNDIRQSEPSKALHSR